MSIGMRCSSNHRMTPTCAMPRALPPPNATPTVGRGSWARAGIEVAAMHKRADASCRVRVRTGFTFIWAQQACRAGSAGSHEFHREPSCLRQPAGADSRYVVSGGRAIVDRRARPGGRRPRKTVGLLLAVCSRLRVFVSWTCRTFRPAEHGGPKGPHYAERKTLSLRPGDPR